MVKKILLLAGILASAVVFSAGCGSSNSGTAEETVNTGEEETQSEETADSEESTGSEETKGSVQKLTVGENTLDVDGDGDGEVESLIIEIDENEEDDTWIQIHYNGYLSGEKNIWGIWEAEPYLIKADGKSYLYVNCSQTGEYESIYVWDLTHGAPIFVGETEDGLCGNEIQDPQTFTLGRRYDCLSTLTVFRTFHVGENGMPMPDSDWYTFQDSAHTLTTRTVMSAEIVEDSSLDNVPSEGEDGEIPAGTPLSFYRTNNVTKTDMKGPDGTIYRITIDQPYSGTVGDVALEELFDGVLFAG